MTTILVAMLAGSAITALYFVVTRRERASGFHLHEDSLAPIEQSMRTIAGLTKSELKRGNKARVFQDEDLLWAAADSIRQARETVHFATFVWKRGEVEREFVSLFCEKAQQGVKVRILADYLGSHSADRKQLDRLRDCGVEFVNDRRTHWFDIRRFNNRMHRKILVVDGKTGYTFGHGIADEWTGHGENKHHWRDTGIMLEGPLVASLESIFAHDWTSACGEVLTREDCFPQTVENGPVEGHAVASSAGDVHSPAALLYMLAIASARREVIIQNPYFTPNPAIPTLLTQMAQKGIAIHLMVPGKYTDSTFVRRAGQHLYLELLRAGVKIHEFKPSLLHQKIVIIDDVWSYIGSTNFDARSLALNSEIGVALLDEAIAAELKEAFEVDLRRCRELTLEAWKQRPWYDKVIDWAAYRLHGQL
jgi:cardiolipin synthase